MYEDYYDEPEYYREPKHSGFGITSFVMALVMGALEFALVVIAGIIENSTPGGMDENSPIAILLGLVMIGGLLVNVLGIVFGVVGLFQPNRKKIFALLGVLFGCLVILGFLFIVVIGLTMG